MVVERLAITRTVVKRQETSPRSHSMPRRCISQVLQNRSSMIKKKTESLWAASICFPWNIQGHNRNHSSNLALGRTSIPSTKRLPWSWTQVQMPMPSIGQPSRSCFQMWNYSQVWPHWRTLIKYWSNQWEHSNAFYGGKAKFTGSSQKWWTLMTLLMSYIEKQHSWWEYSNLVLWSQSFRRFEMEQLQWIAIPRQKWRIPRASKDLRWIAHPIQASRSWWRLQLLQKMFSISIQMVWRTNP